MISQVEALKSPMLLLNVIFHLIYFCECSLGHVPLFDWENWFTTLAIFFKIFQSSNSQIVKQNSNVQSEFLTKSHLEVINPFHATDLFLCPLKTSENLWRSVARNVLVTATGDRSAKAGSYVNSRWTLDRYCSNLANREVESFSNY